MTFQFYPTGRKLARHAFAKFRRPIERLLEPSAGRGDLLVSASDNEHSRYMLRDEGAMMYCRADRIDCIEINLAHHPLLQSNGYRVVGHDFMSYTGATIYSHILMNPPFAEGAEHVLHAWDLLYSGELVAILNAETVRNPCTKKREQLLRIIEQHSASEPEYLSEAFMEPDTERKTAVDIVIIHLEKVGNFQIDFLDGLAKEMTVAAKAEDFTESRTELMVPERWVHNQVIAFKTAVEGLRQSAIATVRASYYADMLGRSIAEAKEPKAPEHAASNAADIINKGYDDLKQRAWSSVLRSSDVTRRLSSQAQKRLESEFKKICDLEFTVDNVYGFLGGIVHKQGDIQIEMLCDVFDLFTRYHSENAVYYQGWKSNTKHRQHGLALRASRIVLPAHRRDWYAGSLGSSLAWDDQQMFADFDKVFALLDGSTSDAHYGLVQMFDKQWGTLRLGGRAQSDYFDARFYRKAGTFHIYPRRKDLVDRLNRLVGKERTWLPPEECATPPGFWEQFENAEKINKAAQRELEKVDRWSLRNDPEDGRGAQRKLIDALQLGASRVGINYDPDRAVQHKPVAMIADKATPAALPAPRRTAGNLSGDLAL